MKSKEQRACSPGSPIIRKIKIASQASLSVLFDPEFLAHENKILKILSNNVFSIICLSFHVVTVFVRGQHEF